MTPSEAAREIVVSIQACGAWPKQRESAVQLEKQIEDTQRRLLESHTEKYRRERARLEGHLDRLKRQAQERTPQ